MPIHATEYRPDGRKSERLVGANGELNASSKVDAISRQQELAHAINQGKVLSDTGEMINRSSEQSRQDFEELSAAFYDNSGSSWAELGSVISATLNESVDRNGFMRRILLRGEVAQGSFPRHRVREIQTRAMVATGAASMRPTMVRNKYILPPEFTISANFLVQQNELNQGSPEILDEKYYDTLKQIMVAEDRLVLSMAKELDGIDNDVVYISGSYTPQAFAQIRGQITHWGHSPNIAILASDIVEDMIGSPTFANYFDPVTKYDIIMTGTLGTLHGTEIVTDQFRDPKLKVLSSGEMFVFGQQDYVGAYTDRGPVESVPQDNRVIKSHPSRGWYFNEFMSMSVHSGRSISHGSR